MSEEIQKSNDKIKSNLIPEYHKEVVMKEIKWIDIEKLNMQTHFGLIGCKNELIRANGDFNTAIELIKKLREKDINDLKELGEGCFIPEDEIEFDENPNLEPLGRLESTVMSKLLIRRTNNISQEISEIIKYLDKNKGNNFGEISFEEESKIEDSSFYILNVLKELKKNIINIYEKNIRDIIDNSRTSQTLKELDVKEVSLSLKLRHQSKLWDFEKAEQLEFQKYLDKNSNESIEDKLKRLIKIDNSDLTFVEQRGLEYAIKHVESEVKLFFKDPDEYYRNRHSNLNTNDFGDADSIGDSDLFINNTDIDFGGK